MKKLLTLLALLCVLCTGAWADGYFRNHRYDVFKSMPIDGSSIVFVGNSITNMHPWVEAFGNNPNIRNRGNSGATSSEILANARSYCVGHPKKIFLMIGINDGPSASSNPNIVSNIRQTIAIFRKVSPTTKIYVQSILPKGGNALVADCNSKLQVMVNEFNQQHAEDHNDVTYIDVYSLLLGKLDTKVANNITYSYDALHMTAAGYEIWTKELQKYLTDENLTSVYPSDTGSKQQCDGLNGIQVSFGARATYFSMLPIQSTDVLFFGDEMVHGGEWHELLGNVSVKNRGTNWGYEGSSWATIDVTKRNVNATFAATGVDKQTPKQVLIYTGTGEVNGKDNKSIETIVAEYKELVDLVRTKTAQTTKISLVSLMPTTSSENNNRVALFNQAIREYANKTNDVEYIDIHSVLANDDGTPKSAYFSGNYLYGPGYVAVANVLKDKIDGCTNAITEQQAADYRESVKATFTASTVANPTAYKLTSQSGNTIAQNLTLVGSVGSNNSPAGRFIFIRQGATGNHYKIYETVSHKYVKLTSNAGTSAKNGTEMVADEASAEVFAITATDDGHFLISPTHLNPTYLNFHGGSSANQSGQTVGFHTNGNGDSGSKWSFIDATIPTAEEFFTEGWYQIQVGEGTLENYDTYRGKYYIKGETIQVNSYTWAATLTEDNTDSKTFVYIKPSTNSKFKIIYNYGTENEYSVTNQALKQTNKDLYNDNTFTANADGTEWSISGQNDNHWAVAVASGTPYIGNFGRNYANLCYFKFTKVESPDKLVVTYIYELADREIGREMKEETRNEAPSITLPDYVEAIDNSWPQSVNQATYTIKTQYKYELPFTAGQTYNLGFWPASKACYAYTNAPQSFDVKLEYFSNESEFTSNTDKSKDPAYVWTVDGDWFNGFTFKNGLGYYIAAPSQDVANNAAAVATTSTNAPIYFDLEYTEGADKGYRYKVRGGSNYLAHYSVGAARVGFYPYATNVANYNANTIKFIPATVKEASNDIEVTFNVTAKKSDGTSAITWTETRTLVTGTSASSQTFSYDYFTNFQVQANAGNYTVSVINNTFNVTATHTLPMVPGKYYTIGHVNGNASNWLKYTDASHVAVNAAAPTATPIDDYIWYVEQDAEANGPYFSLRSKAVVGDNNAVHGIDDGYNAVEFKDKFAYEFKQVGETFRIFEPGGNRWNLGAHGKNSTLGRWQVAEGRGTTFKAIEITSIQAITEGWYQIKVANNGDSYHAGKKDYYVYANSHEANGYTWAMGLKNTSTTDFDTYVYISGAPGNYTLEFLRGTADSYLVAFDATDTRYYSSKSTSVSFEPNTENTEYKIRGGGTHYWKAWELNGASIGAARGNTADDNWFILVKADQAPTPPTEEAVSTITTMPEGQVYSIQNVATQEYAGFDERSSDSGNFHLFTGSDITWLTKLHLYPKVVDSKTYYALRIASADDYFVSASSANNRVFTDQHFNNQIPEGDEYLWEFVPTNDGQNTFAVKSKSTGKIWDGTAHLGSQPNRYAVHQATSPTINNSLDNKYKWQLRNTKEEHVVTRENLAPVQKMVDDIIWHTFFYETVGYPELTDRNPMLMELIQYTNYFSFEYKDPLEFYHYYDAIEQFEEACASFYVNPPVDDAVYKLKAKFADGSYKYVSYDNVAGDTGLLKLTDAAEATQWIVKPEESTDEEPKFSLVDANSGKYLFVESESHNASKLQGGTTSFDKSVHQDKAKVIIKKTMPTNGTKHDEAKNSFLLGCMTIEGTTPNGQSFPLLAGTDGSLHNGDSKEYYFANEKDNQNKYLSCEFLFEEVANPNIIKVTNPRMNEPKKTGLDHLYIGTFSAPYDVDLREIFEWEDYDPIWHDGEKTEFDIEVYTAKIDGKIVHLNQVEVDDSRYILPRNTGVIFIAPAPIRSITTAEAHHIIKANNSGSEYVEINPEDNDLQPTGGFSHKLEEGMFILAPYTNSGTRMEGVGFYKGTPNTYLARNKAYLDLNRAHGAEVGVAAFSYVFDTDEMTTEINSPLINKSQNTEIFDISGRLVNSRTTRGIFINNGKKVIR